MYKVIKVKAEQIENTLNRYEFFFFHLVQALPIKPKDGDDKEYALILHKKGIDFYKYEDDLYVYKINKCMKLDGEGSKSILDVDIDKLDIVED